MGRPGRKKEIGNNKENRLSFDKVLRGLVG